ncbi:hypothetical protein ADK67_33990 [Saccharothrix sp. NRRL B-16348]|uniref:hypothetical protein n=1 Tax=Saccharothrix sp. NRRL B-16348 TaxID=1415542 RepID=UPI0006AE121F|nr:hypothetical protein [Saccharothrix sp. NRRL B-16348]KOX19270.1 hypothetical protein ADK67_33990 [Saccharothrix sp. NRRL B-16348]
MATPEEIRQRVEQADTARSARRATAAQQVGELAHRRAAITERLEDIERQLGDILAAAQDVIDIDELADFTDLKAADLTHWLAGRRTTRTKRKKPTPAMPATQGDASREPTGSRPSPNGEAPAPGEPAAVSLGASATA